jgi:hypothetical protein
MYCDGRPDAHRRANTTIEVRIRPRRMINYTERLTLLMQDIVTRVEPLSFIDPASFLVFARFGRSGAEGAYASCHCLCLPQAEPGYYFWRDRVSGEITRRSEWFQPRTPDVLIGNRRLDYMISFALPRFCDQRLEHSRKRVHYPSGESWLAKLDTVVHELYHIDPQRTGIRQMISDDGRLSHRCHSQAFFSCVAELVGMYLDTRPDPAIYDFLRDDFQGLVARHGAVTATTFRNFPSYPQIYLDPLGAMPDLAPTLDATAVSNVTMVPLRRPSQPTRYSEADLDLRQFHANGARRIDRRTARRAA